MNEQGKIKTKPKKNWKKMIL